MASCLVMLFVVKPIFPNITSAAIHIGFHKHHVKIPPNREGAKNAMALVQKAIRERPKATPSQVTLWCTSKIVYKELMTWNDGMAMT